MAAPTATGYGPYWILLSGLIGGMFGAAAAIIAQFVGDSLARKRELTRFQIQSFERFRREFSESAGLQSIASKHPEERLENKEIEDYLGFFEEIGLYAYRGLVDIELVDSVLGDYMIDCYEDKDIMDFIRDVRIEERDPSYFEFFERLAVKLVTDRNERRLRNK
jgi:hypothetical protein